MHFFGFPIFQPSAGVRLLRDSWRCPLLYSAIQRLCDFPCFIQRPEQIKIQDFYPVRLVKTFNAGILRSMSIASASHLKSCTTLKNRKRLPHTNASCIKSMNQLWFNACGVGNGAGLRTGKTQLPPATKFSFSRQ
jgi:hypothetical protein